MTGRPFPGRAGVSEQFVYTGSIQHLPIRDNDVQKSPRHHFERLQAIERRHDVMTLRLQTQSQNLNQMRLFAYQQYSAHGLPT
ncbi:hypothetical protein B0G75_103613 [Paraburkholderia sp. BL18I3N2]|nr:hypothetical protein B0G75_103613 [Paraburkholderia sp. BL18I3N2]